jgi:hypothetical protein
LIEAVIAVKEELEREDLGQTPDGFRPMTNIGQDGTTKTVIPEA